MARLRRRPLLAAPYAPRAPTAPAPRLARGVLLAGALVAAALAGCVDPAEPAPPAGGGGDDGPAPTGDPGVLDAMAPGEYTAVFETSKGSFAVELWEDKAPVHVGNFLQYAQDDHYAGTVFHRVVKEFVIQGGGFTSPMQPTSQPKPTLAPIPTEIWPGSRHDEGTLGMARTPDPDSATSQFYVSTKRNSNLDSGYTALGKVTHGLDVVKAIEAVPVEKRGNFENVPKEDVVLHGVTVTTPGTPAKPSLAAMRGEYGLAPGGTVSFPLALRNVGGTRATFDLATAGAGLDADVVHEVGELSAGYTGVAIVSVTAPDSFEGGELTVTASSGAETDSVRIVLERIAPVGGPAGDEHPKASVRYVGLYDNGVVFDTTSTTLDDRGFKMNTRWKEHSDPLKVWVAASASGDDDYTPVIDGFRGGVVGLRPGETKTVRLSPDEGYHDGRFRIFEMTLVSLER